MRQRRQCVLQSNAHGGEFGGLGRIVGQIVLLRLIEVGTSLTAKNMQSVLGSLFQRHGARGFLSSDNGREFAQGDLKEWLGEQPVQTLHIDLGSPQQNGKSESMHGKLLDECLDRELFNHKVEARCVIENFRMAFNRQRPHSSLGYQTPDEFAQHWKLNQDFLT